MMTWQIVFLSRRKLGRFDNWLVAPIIIILDCSAPKVHYVKVALSSRQSGCTLIICYFDKHHKLGCVKKFAEIMHGLGVEPHL